ncbi:hypothetical protein GWI33_012742 [Rhynchophorus ferrugineus]|uniref:Uncharacterized protein n=1 Tax=Rhynchophorus ferrugineus TaxID=354439 RepID=A0A834IRG4_RHYFE|nr:hypothetical protein GWI33_012742 [Rhynchophorus ferrugineus]
MENIEGPLGRPEKMTLTSSAEGLPRSPKPSHRRTRKDNPKRWDDGRQENEKQKANGTAPRSSLCVIHDRLAIQPTSPIG